MKQLPENQIRSSGERFGIAFFLFFFILFTGCRQNPEGIIQSENYPSIYPDYINVTIPFNVAPLNFKMKDKCQRIEVSLSGKNDIIKLQSAYKISIPRHRWKRLLEAQKNDSVVVNISALIDGKWYQYKTFSFYVSADMIDPYLSYRLIEPGYEVWHKLQICQRNIESFEETVIVDNNLIDGGCINCHTYSKQDPSLSFFHLRHKNGGTIIQKNGQIRKLNLVTDSTISAGVYGNWHPGGRFIVFSTNVIIPEFHSIHNKRLEVYDTISDVVLLDIEKNEIFTTGLLSGKSSFETFPVFSADGRKLFFCSAKALKMPENYQSVRYSLCSIAFDPETRSFGSQVDTLISSFRTGKTVSQPKASPDGKYILFTSFDYGNFPVWHKEADLHLMNLSTNSVDTLELVNSDNSDSYHSWSSDSHWFVFASKRDDGMYGKPYFTHIDENGKCSKPFLLPQKNADFYDFFLKSYNIPELANGPVPFDPFDIERSFEKLKAETVKFVSHQIMVR